MSDKLRPCWQNSFISDDNQDKELADIDAMEDSLAPLDEDTVDYKVAVRSCKRETNV